MRRFLVLAACVLCASVAPVYTQAPSAPKQGHEHDFDYLLGDWQFVATNKQYGKTHKLDAKIELKKLMPEDAKEAIGHGIRAKRSKAGAIGFDQYEATVASHAAL